MPLHLCSNHSQAVSNNKRMHLPTGRESKTARESSIMSSESSSSGAHVFVTFSSTSFHQKVEGSPKLICDGICESSSGVVQIAQGDDLACSAGEWISDGLNGRRF